jgi:hypothetical protein
VLGLLVATGLLGWAVGGRSAPSSTTRLHSCPVTLPNANRTPYDPAPGPQIGNGWLWVSAYPFGVTVARKQEGTIRPDGTIDVKFGWYRKEAGRRLTIAARRLDKAARPGKPFVPAGYGGNFQASGITFSSEGCWRITGRAGRHRLSFVTLVVKG